MLLLKVSEVCEKYQLTRKVEDLAGLRRGTLRSILSGRPARQSRSSTYGLPRAVRLIVQYLYEMSAEAAPSSPRRAAALVSDAEENTKLNAECHHIPGPEQPDGATSDIRPKGRY